MVHCQRGAGVTGATTLKFGQRHGVTVCAAGRPNDGSAPQRTIFEFPTIAQALLCPPQACQSVAVIAERPDGAGWRRIR